jgi:hypothetical protein
VSVRDSDLINVRFSNRPIKVKRFQTIRRRGEVLIDHGP